MGRNPNHMGLKALPRQPIRPGWPVTPAVAASSAFQPAAPRPVDVEPGGVRKFALYAGLAMLFVRISVFSDIIQTLTGLHTYLLYLVGPPAILGAVVTGGLGRTFSDRVAWFWLAFTCCMGLSVPFSTWMGGSSVAFQAYVEFSFPFLFTMGGLATNWREIRLTFYTMALAGGTMIVAARFMSSSESGRMEMAQTSSTIGNSNDLASLLILVMPFLLFVSMDRRRSAIIRYPMMALIGYCLILIVRTASRGAVVALAVAFLFYLYRASMKQRIAMLVVTMTLVALAPAFIGGNTLDRLASLSGEEAHEEADASKESRTYLLQQSLLYTIQHPAFGVGLGQFALYEGELAKSQGRVGNWHETHNAFTQVSSECGIVALIFFVLAIAGSFRTVSRIYKQARRQGHQEIASAAFCYLLSFTGFLVSIVFLANAYRLYLPTMIGLSIAFKAAAKRELNPEEPPAPPRPVYAFARPRAVVKRPSY